MANVFVNLPMPAGDGPGAAVDVSTMGKEKSIVMGGLFTGATVTVEASTDGGSVFQPVWLFSGPGKKVLPVAAQFLRVFVRGRNAAPFSANADVGGNDNGALFTALPVPTGDGPGTPVNVSTFGNYTTFIAGGSFRDATISIEVSEDGTSYSPCGQVFSGQGGQESRDIVANFMRTFVRGRAGNTFPFTPTISVGAINDAITTAPPPPASIYNETLIYRETSPDNGPLVFGTWAGLMTRLAALKAMSNGAGIFRIAFDDSLVAPFTGVTIPAAGSPHDMEGVTWDNGDFIDQTAFVNVADGATFTKLRRITGRMIVTCLSAGASPSPVSDFAPLLEQVVLGRGATIVTAGNPFFDFSVLGAGDSADLYLTDNSTVLAAGTVETGSAGSTLAMRADVGSGAAAGAFSGPVGATLLKQGPPNMIYGRDAAFLGTTTTTIDNIGPMGGVSPIPPAAAAVAPFSATFNDTVQRFDASGGAIAQVLPTLPVSGGQEGGRARMITVVEESGTAGLTVAPAGGDTINGAATPIAVPAGGSVTFLGDGESNWYVQATANPIPPMSQCFTVVGPFTFPAGGAAAINDIVQVDVSGGIVPVTLPAIAAANAGCQIVIKKIAGGGAAFTATGAGGDTIDGVAGAAVFAGALVAVYLVSDGVSNWMVI